MSLRVPSSFRAVITSPVPVWTPYPPLVSVPGRQMSYLAFVPYLLPSSPFAAALPNTTGVSLRPNDQLACLDEVMAGTDRADVTPYEELGTGKGSWAGIGKQLRFTPALEKEARRVVARAFGWEGEGKGKKVSRVASRSLPVSLTVADGSPSLLLLPGFSEQHITLHIRHGDFLEFQCQPNDPCWSVEQFHSAVAQLQASLPSPVKDVLVLTDEIDPTFIAEARALGWKFAEDGMTGPGGEEIKKKLGGWCVVAASHLNKPMFLALADRKLLCLAFNQVRYTPRHSPHVPRVAFRRHVWVDDVCACSPAGDRLGGRRGQARPGERSNLEGLSAPSIFSRVSCLIHVSIPSRAAPKARPARGGAFWIRVPSRCQTRPILSNLNDPSLSTHDPLARDEVSGYVPRFPRAARLGLREDQRSGRLRPPLPPPQSLGTCQWLFSPSGTLSLPQPQLPPRSSPSPPPYHVSHPSKDGLFSARHARRTGHRRRTRPALWPGAVWAAGAAVLA